MPAMIENQSSTQPPVKTAEIQSQSNEVQNESSIVPKPVETPQAEENAKRQESGLPPARKEMPEQAESLSRPAAKYADVPLEACLDLIHKEGYSIFNLCQLDNGSWQCNLRRLMPNGTTYWQYAYGNNIKEALLAAWAKSKIDHGEIRLPAAPKNFISKRGSVDIDTLLAGL